jgi:predicted GIY-YIG superfamily endonuclease
MNWDEIQKLSGTILSQGIFALKNSPVISPKGFRGTFPCNYLISLHGRDLYLGEGKVANERIAKQFRAKTSTFFNNYKSVNPSSGFSIDDFQLQIIESKIGRKEIEDFGISNLSTGLNKFQLNKRDIIAQEKSTDVWDICQSNSDQLVKEGGLLCLQAAYFPWSSAAPPKSPGIYIIKSDQGEIIYVGESSDVGKRYSTHDSRTYFSAVRRNLGEEILGYRLQTRNGKKRYFEQAEGIAITKFLHSCSITFVPIQIGRYEVEEFLIRKLSPLINRKSKARSE